jgi:hypothetical protein
VGNANHGCELSVRPTVNGLATLDLIRDGPRQWATAVHFPGHNINGNSFFHQWKQLLPMVIAVTISAMETTITRFAQKVSENLRAEMARKNLGINELAQALQCSRPTARSRFYGRSALTLGELSAAATWLGITIDDLTHEKVAA